LQTPSNRVETFLLHIDLLTEVGKIIKNISDSTTEPINGNVDCKDEAETTGVAVTGLASCAGGS